MEPRGIDEPYWVWGALCAAFSALTLLVGGWHFLRGARPRPTPAAHVPA